MDIDQALEDMREALADLDQATSISQESDAAERLATAATAIDTWLSKGGFLPAAWAR
jgi:hypothetical protein